jgi:RNA polymerase sporulation-specific sigma factor
MPEPSKRDGASKNSKTNPDNDVTKTEEYLINIKNIKFIEIIRKNKNNESVNNAFDSLLKTLMPKIQKLISKFNIPGSDHSDVLQEALYALRYKAIKDYDKERGTGTGPAAFDKFALLCIRRHLATEFKSSYQNKKRVLNQSMSIDRESSSSSGDEDISLSSILGDPDKDDVLTEIGDKEYYRNLQKRLLESLSSFEKEVYTLYIQKYSYEEISEKINEGRMKVKINIKGVDNALSRIKYKAKEILDGYESENDCE